MKRIPLTQGQHALVDDEDYEWLMEWKWQAHRGRNDHTWYAVRDEYLGGGRNNRKVRRVQMHRLILDAPPDLHVDHEDGNGLNNQRANLRLATPAQNQRNRPHHSGSFKGVSFRKDVGLWRARITVDRATRTIGLFATAEEAARAYDRIAVELHGEFATTNEGLGLLC